MTQLIVLDYSTCNVDFYNFNVEMTDDEIRDFLFVHKGYNESEINWMYATKLNINNYENNY